MLVSLLLPVAITAVALFFMSFLSWMVLQLHKADWRKLPNEPEVEAAVKQWKLPAGAYMFPYCESNAQMKDPEFQKKFKEGYHGIVQILPHANMGFNLAFTIVYFFAVSFGMAYLSSVAFKEGESFLNVFRFVFTGALFAYLSATIQHSIWFKTRVVGHIIESLCYAAITAVIFAAMWPK